MGMSSDILKKGASRIRSLVHDNLELKNEIAEFGTLKEAIATVEKLVKAGRLEDSDEPIVKRAEALMAAENYESLTKEAASGNTHIDLELFGDLEIEPAKEKTASKAKDVELDVEHNDLHRLLYGGE